MSRPDSKILSLILLMIVNNEFLLLGFKMSDLVMNNNENICERIHCEFGGRKTKEYVEEIIWFTRDLFYCAISLRKRNYVKILESCENCFCYLNNADHM